MSADGDDVSNGESSVSESSDSEHEVDTQDSLEYRYRYFRTLFHFSNPWSRPEWKRHFILTIGFSIQRGNTAMFVLSDDRRRSQSKKFRASGPSSHHLG